MTLDEAITHAREIAKNKMREATYNFPSLQEYYDECMKCANEHEMLVNWLEDLQHYKDTGLTPRQMIEIDKLYSEQAKELGEYKKLGTLEEVREAVEKQKRKKPCTSNRCYVCPHCGLVTSLKTKHNYCDACGQRISWEEL